MANLSKTVAIVGVAESDEIGRIEKSNLQLHAEAAYNALEDAGLTMKDAPFAMYSAAVGASRTEPAPRITSGNSIDAQRSSSENTSHAWSPRLVNSIRRIPPARQARTTDCARSISPV